MFYLNIRISWAIATWKTIALIERAEISSNEINYFEQLNYYSLSRLPQPRLLFRYQFRLVLPRRRLIEALNRALAAKIARKEKMGETSFKGDVAFAESSLGSTLNGRS